MGRYDRRIQRLTARVQGNHASLQQARLQRMTDKELEAEVIKLAVKWGLPEDEARADPAATLRWLDKRARATVEALPNEEREEWKARLNAVPFPTGWPSIARP